MFLASLSPFFKEDLLKGFKAGLLWVRYIWDYILENPSKIGFIAGVVCSIFIFLIALAILGSIPFDKEISFRKRPKTSMLKEDEE